MKIVEERLVCGDVVDFLAVQLESLRYLKKKNVDLNWQPLWVRFSVLDTDENGGGGSGKEEEKEEEEEEEEKAAAADYVTQFVP